MVDIHPYRTLRREWVMSSRLEPIGPEMLGDLSSRRG